MRKSTLVLFLLLCCSSIFAQIVNIETRRSSRVDTSGIFGDITLGFNFIENGNTILTINGGLNLEWMKDRHLLLSFTRYNLGRVEQNQFINDGFQHLRYNYKINQRFTWEVFTQAQYNERIRLQLRYLSGTGPRLTIVGNKKHKVYVGVLYMYEYNEESVKDSQTIIHFRDHRLSSYLSFSVQPLSNIQISSTSYFQPVVSDFKDLRLSSETSCQIEVTKRLFFNTSFNILYDTRVPEDVPNTIYAFKNGLKWNF